MKQSYVQNIISRCETVLTRMEGKRVFVAGGSGFYGSWLVKVLEEAGIEVEWGARSNGWDILDPSTYTEFQKDADYVINAAGKSDGVLDNYDVMSEGPVNLFDAMEYGFGTMLQISSGAAPNLRTIYASSKRLAEIELTGKAKIIRPYATVGPGMGLDRTFAISNFIRQALAGEPLSVAPGITRSFCHITDMIVQMLHVLVAGDHLPYDAGSDDAITMEEAARVISPNVVLADKEFQSNANCDYYVANLTRMRTLLRGVKSDFDLIVHYHSEEAIADTYKYYKEVQ